MTLTQTTWQSLSPYHSYPVFQLLQKTAERLPNKVAIIDGEKKVTYSQLNAYSDRLGAALISMGIKKGAHVGILSPNCIEFEVAYYGVAKAGAVATTINPGYREMEIAHQLNVSGAELLIVHESLLQTAVSARGETPELKRLVVIEEGSDNAESFWSLIEHAPDQIPEIPINAEEDLAILPFSSGTTGLPKGVMLTHQSIAANLRQFFDRKDDAVMRPDDVIVLHLPLFHMYGNFLMHGAVRAGATQVLMDRFDMEQFLTLLSKYRGTHLYTVPPVALGITQYPDVDRFDLSSIRAAVLAAAPMSGDLQRQLSSSLGTKVIQVYGMTELSPVANSDFFDDSLLRPGTVGPAVADTEEKIVDLETGTREVASGEAGELWVRGPQVMKGYFENAEATAETITHDGWMRTGDIVKMDSDGYVTILDRKKELIKYKGFQVAPAELEGLLLNHPGILDAAVIGKPDAEAGEVPKAFVVARGDVEVSAESVMDFVADKVATFKRIREVEFIDAIPKNPSGKILRRLLIEQEREKYGEPR